MPPRFKLVSMDEMLPLAPGAGKSGAFQASQEGLIRKFAGDML